MAEAEAVLTRELRLLGPDQTLADERGQPRRHLAFLVGKCLHRAPVEHLALDRASLEHLSLGRLELVEAGCEQRLQRGRYDGLASRVSCHRHHLLDEQRVAAGGAGDLRAQPAGDALGDQLFGLLGA